MPFTHRKISLEKTENLNRRKGTCMKCYDIEVLNAEMTQLLARRRFQSYVNLVENINLINESIMKWRIFEPTLH